jgi:hypothetical protein
MGITKTAAALAALLAAVSIGMSLGLHSRPDDSHSAQAHGDAAIQDIRAGYTVRGQAWATELFGRRYGRHLMAAASQQTDDSKAGA